MSESANRPRAIVVAPDSFKGSLSASEVAAAVADGIRRVWPDASCIAVPMADGGEGTLDACLSAGGERRRVAVHGASGAPLGADLGIVERNGVRTAIVEIAQVVGITEPVGMAVPVGARTTRGVGELLRAALDLGLRDFFIALGGSSTNDGGAGLLVGLGARLLDADGRDVEPAPRDLSRVRAIDLSAFDPRVRDCRVTLMSDVNNPLAGPRGATAIFGPQKGVTASEHAPFDGAIAHFAAIAETGFGSAAAEKPGAGAAGGLGFAAQLVGGEFRSGAEVVADLLQLDAALAGADWALTGEGRSDAQTLLGKTPYVVAERARRAGVPITLLSGAIDRTALPALDGIFSGCFSLVFGPTTLERAIADAAGLLADSAEQLARLRQSAES